MAKNIEPKLKKIGDYLKLEEDTVFTIPEYQRAYSWGIDHCDKLWQDINDFVESESKDRCLISMIWLKQHLNQCCLRRYKEPKRMDILTLQTLTAKRKLSL